ncbi:PTS glucose transporter subunit IIA [Actinotalea ferrariae CF5-4]|uniref:PTS glucose transporter subunit IIA n=1 Tax=Actinotalea ferrariae CF5-4 TaxID=948458 RepID=A0A021VQV0_9CELL|nr:PTS glucose transporter subunit IIA [Actinotalea ferrariae]EYR63579.1 PTS glucose transporter subunit IIA [Actinotalea ferrariae CF5-4]
MPTTVHAPLAGVVRALAEVPDPVFAAAMVGPGLAIDPTGAGRVTATAPVSGVVSALHPHAFVVVTAEGRGVLVHLGIDTVQLRGAGFTVHARRHQEIRQGEAVVTWRPGEVAAGGRSAWCPVVALDAAAVTELVAPSSDVAAGAPLLLWA